jgi:zinc protease
MGHIHFSRKILSNGLIVIHHHDTTSPFVVFNLLYKVGARDESPDNTGFAHLFEHLMFEGTKEVPYFDGPLQEAGGENNAFTNNDYTNYYDIVPDINLEIPFWLESDRMANLRIRQTSLDLQKKVVIEEFKENYINQPYGDAFHHLRKMVYKVHPYRWPTIGKKIDHIKNATLKNVKSFFQQYYVPNNAIIAIGGNIEGEHAFELADKWFGDIRPNPDLKKLEFTEPEQTSATLKTIKSDVPHDAIFIAFKMPGRLENGYYAADVATDILASGPSSRLYQKLVKEAGLFSEIDAYISGSNDTGMLIIEGKVSEGKAVSAATSALWDILKEMQQHLIGEEELRKVKNKMITYMNFSDASLLNRMISLAYYEMLGDAEWINLEEYKYENVSALEIMAFCQSTFVHEKSNTLYYLRQEA